MQGEINLHFYCKTKALNEDENESLKPQIKNSIIYLCSSCKNYFYTYMSVISIVWYSTLNDVGSREAVVLNIKAQKV